MKTSKELLYQLIEKANNSHGLDFCHHYYERNQPEVCTIATNAENLPKNRHNRWGFPFDHNLITSIPEYINASPMQFNNRSYIAAQGPRTNTFSEFWKMVQQERVTLILSVTNEREDRKGYMNFKFDRFWPESGSMDVGNKTISLHSERLVKEWDGRQEKLRERRLILQDENGPLELVHLHMENWPDNGVIHPESLVELGKTADLHHRGGPIVVHCAAGVGRTGTFIGYHSLYHDFKEQLEQNQKPHIDIPGRIHQMRSLRWGAVVSDIKQYELILSALELSF